MSIVYVFLDSMSSATQNWKSAAVMFRSHCDTLRHIQVPAPTPVIFTAQNNVCQEMCDCDITVRNL